MNFTYKIIQKQSRFEKRIPDFFKNKILLLFLILIYTGASAEKPETLSPKKVKVSAFYGSLGFGIGRQGTPAGFSHTLILSNNIGISLSYKYKTMIAADLPALYSDGLNIFLEEKNSKPSDQLNINSIMLLREFPTSFKRLRFGFEAGPSLIHYRRAEFTPIAQNGIWGGPNYTYTYREFRSAGLSMRAKLALPLSKGFGIEIAALSNINKYHTFVAAEIGITFGWLR